MVKGEIRTKAQIPPLQTFYNKVLNYANIFFSILYNLLCNIISEKTLFVSIFLHCVSFYFFEIHLSQNNSRKDQKAAEQFPCGELFS